MGNVPIYIGHYLSNKQLHGSKVAVLVKDHLKIPLFDLCLISIVILDFALISIDHARISVKTVAHFSQVAGFAELLFLCVFLMFDGLEFFHLFGGEPVVASAAVFVKLGGVVGLFVSEFFDIEDGEFCSFFGVIVGGPLVESGGLGEVCRSGAKRFTPLYELLSLCLISENTFELVQRDGFTLHITRNAVMCGSNWSFCSLW